MSSNREIQKKINSIYNTQKITKAMEMVAISKIRKVRNKINSGQSYFQEITRIITSVIDNKIQDTYNFYTSRKVKRIGLLIISTNRGLCGSLNTNLFKKINLYIKEHKNKNILCNLFILGLKGILFFNAITNKIILKIKNFNNSTHLTNVVNELITCYKKKQIDKLFIASNYFQNTMLQVPTIACVLPITSHLIKKKSNLKDSNYIYEPNLQFLLDNLIKYYLRSTINKCILENLLCEHSARMIAMKTATDNSKNIIKDLQLVYNKSRQSNITQELNEIISGMSVILLD